MELYKPCNWFDVEKLCEDDIGYHDKKNLLVDYGSYEKLKEKLRLADLLIDKINDNRYRQMISTYRLLTKSA